MLVEDLLTWAANLPLWQQDALRRIAQTSSLAESDVREIRENLYIVHGLMESDSRTLRPIAQEHLPAEKNRGPRTILREIDKIRNTNRLAKDQTLRFAGEGITLIYGDNGSGKSGYCRIAKKLCRARAVDPILDNVFETSASKRATAVIRFQIEGSNVKEIQWEDGQLAPEATSRISVFDSRSASLYVDDKNRIDFLPLVIDVVKQLGHLCIRLSEYVKEDLSKLEKRLITALPRYPSGTRIASMVESIKTDTPLSKLISINSVMESAFWTEEDDQRLREIE
jgi:hypothetical protein